MGLRVGLAADRNDETPASEALLRRLLRSDDQLRRRPDGKPEGKSWLSAAHAGSLTLGVAAEVQIGCDAELVIEKKRGRLAQSPRKGTLRIGAVDAQKGYQNIGEAATRVWCAVEAIKKAGAEHVQTPLTFENHGTDCVRLAAGELAVATWVGPLDSGVLALAIALQVPDAKLVPSTRSARDLGAISPAPMRIYSYRHVVGFGDTNLVGNVYFVNHIEWQGRCREMFLREKAPEVVQGFAQGLALVTTRCSCEYLSELMGLR